MSCVNWPEWAGALMCISQRQCDNPDCHFNPSFCPRGVDCTGCIRGTPVCEHCQNSDCPYLDAENHRKACAPGNDYKSLGKNQICDRCFSGMCPVQTCPQSACANPDCSFHKEQPKGDNCTFCQNALK